MARLTEDDLRRSTLSRQFPPITGTDETAVVALIDRLGPIQSQVPRAPFLAISSRLPGTSYATVRGLFASHRLLKTSNLRGTVHTSTRRNFACLDAVATATREPQLRKALRLAAVTPGEVNDEVRRFCHGQWRPRPEILEHIRGWLQACGADDSAAALGTTFSDAVVWGNSGLVRRPRDEAWEKRTDIFHRTAAALLPDLRPTTLPEALVALVHDHLVAYGPLRRQDLAFFFGVGLTQVDAAVFALGERLVRHEGPGPAGYLDVAAPPVTDDADPGVRLLAEFDGLLLGFSGANRNRFVDAEGLAKIWARTNGLFSPAVLRDGRLVATWKTLTRGSRTDIEVTLLQPGERLAEDQLQAPVAAVETALALQVADVRVLPAP